VPVLVAFGFWTHLSAADHNQMTASFSCRESRSDHLPKVGVLISKTLASAIALAAAIASARAGDLNSSNIKDPLPDALTWKGVTYTA
jgi:hypothetical protein